MIDTAALRDAIADFEGYTAFVNADGGKVILDAARLLLAAQAAPGEEAPVEAMLRRLEQLGLSGRFSAQTLTDIQTIIPELRLAASRASLHRPVEARVTEEMVERANAAYWDLARACRGFECDGKDAARCTCMTAALKAASLPSPQVTREAIVASLHGELTHPEDDAACQRAADRILALFDGKAKP